MENEGHVLTLNSAKQFITAGKAIFTISNGNGKHFTYKIRKVKLPGRDFESYFVYVLTDSDNESSHSYAYMGALDPARMILRLTQKSKFKDENQSVRVVRWALGHIYQGKPFPAGYAIRHEGRCGRCARLLTTPESIDTGVGPECASILGIEWKENPSTTN